MFHSAFCVHATFYGLLLSQVTGLDSPAVPLPPSRDKAALQEIRTRRAYNVVDELILTRVLARGQSGSFLRFVGSCTQVKSLRRSCHYHVRVQI